MCPEDMTSQLEEEEEFVDCGAVLLDDGGGPSFRGVSPPAYQRRSPPQRSVSESELSRVRAPQNIQSVQPNSNDPVCVGGLEWFWFFGHRLADLERVFFKKKLKSPKHTLMCRELH